MPFGMVCRTGPGMRQVVGFGDRSTGRSNFGGEYGAPHCNRREVCGITGLNCVNRRSCGYRLGWCVKSAEALVYSMGVHVVQVEGEVLVVFVP